MKLAADLGARAIGFATTVLVGRALSVAQFGLFGLLSDMAVLVAELSDLGLQTTTTRELVAGRFPIRSPLRAKLLLTSATLAAALAGAAIGKGFGARYAAWPIGLFTLLLMHFVLAGWVEWLGVVLRTLKKRIEEAWALLCLRAMMLVLTACAVAFAVGLPGLAWAYAAAPVLAIVLAGWRVRRASAAAPSETPVVAPLAVLRMAAPLGIGGVLTLLGLRLEVLTLGVFVGVYEAGLFRSALFVLMFLLTVPSAVCQGAMPALTREAIQGGSAVRERTSATLAILGVPATIGLWLVPGVVGTLFGGEYTRAAPIVWVLAGAVPALFMNVLVSHSLVATGRAARVARLTALRTAVAAIAALALIPRAGAMGAAAGFAASESILLLLGARACRDAGFRVPVARPLLRGAALSLPMAAVVAASGGGDLLRVLAGVAVYALTLGLALKTRPALLGITA